MRRPASTLAVRTAARWAGLLGTLLLAAACGGGGGGASSPTGGETPAPSAPAAALPTPQELQCQAAGWQREVVVVAGRARLVLWKAPAGGAWRQGAIVVMHGGGGTHTNFCVANVALIAPQVRFTDQALAEGFAVFLLDSSDQVLDPVGRLCGKIWDDPVNPRENLDLPFIDQVLGALLPARRPAGSRGEVFLTGLSSGGFMALRAASRFGDRIAALAPVSAGDPYGWVRDCAPLPTDRTNVFGVGRDADTGRTMSEPGACAAPVFAREQPWDTSPGGVRPPVRQFHHEADGILDRSCVQRATAQMAANGFRPQAPFELSGPPRDAAWHYWLDDYNTPILRFFAAQIR